MGLALAAVVWSQGRTEDFRAPRTLKVGVTPWAIRVGAIAPPINTLLHAPVFFLQLFKKNLSVKTDPPYF